MNAPPTHAASENNPAPPDAPPILGTWRRMYILVLVVLLAGVLLFAWLTKVYQ